MNYKAAVETTVLSVEVVLKFFESSSLVNSIALVVCLLLEELVHRKQLCVPCCSIVGGQFRRHRFSSIPTWYPLAWRSLSNHSNSKSFRIYIFHLGQCLSIKDVDVPSYNSTSSSNCLPPFSTVEIPMGERWRLSPKASLFMTALLLQCGAVVLFKCQW